MAEGGDLRNYMIIILVLSIFMISISPFIDETATVYSLTEDKDIPSGSVYYGNMTTSIGDIQGDLDTDIEGDLGEDNLLVASWKMIKKTYKSTTRVGDLFKSFGEVLGLDEDIVNGFIGILTIVIIFAIIGVVTRTRAP